MELCYDGALVMPSSYAVMDEEEMTYVEGGGWKEKVIEFAINYIIAKGIDYVISHRKKIWKSFLKGLAPTDATKEIGRAHV